LEKIDIELHQRLLVASMHRLDARSKISSRLMLDYNSFTFNRLTQSHTDNKCTIEASRTSEPS
jgi:hypothetical protein